ncbi:MAG: 4-phosphoerythronate dehydrogenase PdxB [Lentisphaerae bacterium]|nr:4-phosphoerythronate dehydrogenase PdxB [Lentisphaerota bacterium]
MKIVCSAEMPYAREAFGTLGEVAVVDGRSIRAAHVRDADILAVRSTTRVDRALLEGSRVRFAGTATIGFDHMDLPYLEARGIRWCCAPGCNARSVAEYVAAALLRLAARHGLRLEGRTIGVVGVGNVGSLVLDVAAALGLRALPNDPPRERKERARPNADNRPAATPRFVSLDAVLAESDIVTLHVPLTKTGPDATFHMADEAFFARARPGCVFINSARGAVVKTDALLRAMDRGTVAHAVIDTWEGEPSVRRDLLERADFGTPHVAGYSYDGRVAGTRMVYEAACAFLGKSPDWSPEPLLPPPPAPRVEAEAAGRDDEAVLDEIVRRVYDIAADDAAFRAETCADPGKAAAHFDALRRDYPVRREFRYTRVALRNGTPALARRACALGFRADRT